MSYTRLPTQDPDAFFYPKETESFKRFMQSVPCDEVGRLDTVWRIVYDYYFMVLPLMTDPRIFIYPGAWPINYEHQDIVDLLASPDHEALFKSLNITRENYQYYFPRDHVKRLWDKFVAKNLAFKEHKGCMRNIPGMQDFPVAVISRPDTEEEEQIADHIDKLAAKIIADNQDDPWLRLPGSVGELKHDPLISAVIPFNFSRDFTSFSPVPSEPPSMFSLIPRDQPLRLNVDYKNDEEKAKIKLTMSAIMHGFLMAILADGNGKKLPATPNLGFSFVTMNLLTWLKGYPVVCYWLTRSVYSKFPEFKPENTRQTRQRLAMLSSFLIPYILEMLSLRTFHKTQPLNSYLFAPFEYYTESFVDLITNITAADILLRRRFDFFPQRQINQTNSRRQKILTAGVTTAATLIHALTSPTKAVSVAALSAAASAPVYYLAGEQVAKVIFPDRKSTVTSFTQVSYHDKLVLLLVVGSAAALSLLADNPVTAFTYLIQLVLVCKTFKESTETSFRHSRLFLTPDVIGLPSASKAQNQQLQISIDRFQ